MVIPHQWRDPDADIEEGYGRQGMPRIRLGSSSEVTVDEIDEVVVLELTGVFADGPNATKLGELVKEKHLEGKRKFLFKCGKLRFINSTGIGLLVGIQVMIQKEGGCMKLCEVNRRIRKTVMFSSCPVFEVLEDCEEALRRFP
jgi:anti-sigma B factor antagonist